MCSIKSWLQMKFRTRGRLKRHNNARDCHYMHIYYLWRHRVILFGSSCYIPLNRDDREATPVIGAVCLLWCRDPCSRRSIQMEIQQQRCGGESPFKQPPPSTSTSDHCYTHWHKEKQERTELRSQIVCTLSNI